MSARSPDVLMDETTGDLPVFSRFSSGTSTIAQRVECRLLTHQGDWPLEQDAGIAWTEILGTKPSDLEGLAALVAVEIANTPGVSAIEDLDWSEGSAPGDAVITATVLTTEDEVIEIVVTPQGIDGNPSIATGGVLAHSRTVAP